MHSRDSHRSAPQPAETAAATGEPPPWSYWVVPGRFLAGCFPGAQHPQEQEEKLRRLLDAGVRVFISLMEEDETNRAGTRFSDYAGSAARLAERAGAQVRCVRHPIRDLNVPTVEQMESILDEIDGALEEGPVYLHCWGGVGRTGTVVACWLLRHGRATGADVLDVLRDLRRMDRERGRRASPEMPVQVRFVEQWAACAAEKRRAAGA